jgi:RHS repeat-associated protein
MQLAENIGGVPRTTNYTYDDLYRLTREDIVSTGSVAYTHDKVGNRLSRLVSGTGILPVLPGVSSYTYDLNDRLLSADARSYTYDANGNTRTGSVGGAGVSPASGSGLPVIPVSDQYDDQNRLVQRTETENGKVITILYDADGNRVAKTVNGVTTYYLVDSQNPTGYAQVIEEITAPVGTDPIAIGTVTKRYAYGLDLISQQVWTTGDPLAADHWRTSYYGYDGLGSIRYLTDETAFITDHYTYDAFGTLLDAWSANPLIPADNVYLYVGEQFDPDLGLYYNRARYLNIDTGRFWSMDSYEGNNQEPLSLHKYLYAHGNPVMFTDPSGNMSMTSIGVALSTWGTLAVGMIYRMAPTLNRVSIILYEATTGNTVIMGAGGASVVLNQAGRMGGVSSATWLRIGQILRGSSNKIGTYNEVARVLKGTVNQANHLNQVAAFPKIPKGEGVANALEGGTNIAGSAHHLFHKSLEVFWKTFRAGPRKGMAPTNAEYDTALETALKAAGKTVDEAKELVDLAREARHAYGYHDGMGGLLPTIPNPIPGL